jgi:hypothetical protein
VIIPSPQHTQEIDMDYDQYIDEEVLAMAEEREYWENQECEFDYAGE